MCSSKKLAEILYHGPHKLHAFSSVASSSFCCATVLDIDARLTNLDHMIFYLLHMFSFFFLVVFDMTYTFKHNQKNKLNRSFCSSVIVTEVHFSVLVLKLLIT